MAATEKAESNERGAITLALAALFYAARMANGRHESAGREQLVCMEEAEDFMKMAEERGHIKFAAKK